MLDGGRMLDVIVVGAGPAGLYSALLLAEEGFDVAVLEEHALPGAPTHCTGVISDELSDLFKVPESLILNRPAVCTIVSPSGTAMPFASNDERIAVIDRGQFDAELGLAAQRAGAEVRTEFRVDRVWPAPDAVCVEGSGGRLRGRVCVLACGVGYGLQRQLGLGLPSLFLHSAQLELDADGSSTAVELHVGRTTAPEGFAWLVPIVRDGRARMKAGLMTRGDAAEHLDRFLARPGVRERLAPQPAPAIRRLLPLGPVNKTYGERVVAVGDAAGLTKPTTGGGIFYSLLSGLLAAETLSEALRRDRLGEAALRVYETRWRARLDPHLRVSSYLRRLFIKLTDQEMETLLEVLVSERVQEIIRRTAHFNWHGELIRSILQQRGIKSILFHALLR
ncbi:MAG TPA: NAD(P)/FAD-dependent oxidoreductase [Methylomirabilota bacterium]|jgi:geranylgeranyl reductase family protein|nr:NAD(P)/FAD-dependent oxidoreductase [Methylomirabilota bacterium]